ncbi:MAG: trigger factor [Chloroflexota bacterium]|nr:trigger factor [Dehalococcoidia bacterium]MDW8253367.1 trigger factor [Chloroflexota bacterium]
MTSERAPESQVILTIEIEPAELERSLESAYQRLAPRALVPGFRKGKAPRAIIERYFGRAALLEDAIEHLAPKVAQDAIQQEKIEPLSQPRLEVTQLDPVVVKATVDVKPTIDLREYQSIRVDIVEPTLEEDAVDRAIESVRERHAIWEPVERPIAEDDLVLLDYRAWEGERPVGSADGLTYRVIVDRRDPLPGFARELIGMSAGETKTFTLSYGEEDAAKELAGKSFDVSVTVREVKGKRLPDLDEAFIQEVTGDLKTIEELRERVEANLRRRAEIDAYAKMRDAALSALSALAEAEAPYSLIESQLDQMIEERRSLMQRSGIRWEDYVRVVGGSEEAIREQLRDEARERVRRRLLLSELATVEGITVTADEINDELADQIRTSGLSAAQASRVLEHPNARAIAEQNLRVRKALARLVEIATEGKVAPPAGEVDPALVGEQREDEEHGRRAGATEEG